MGNNRTHRTGCPTATRSRSVLYIHKVRRHAEINRYKLETASIFSTEDAFDSTQALAFTPAQETAVLLSQWTAISLANPRSDKKLT